MFSLFYLGLSVFPYYPMFLFVSLFNIHQQHHFPLPDPHATMTIDARLGYRNKKDPHHKWTEYATSVEERTLDCHIDPKHQKEEYIYNCSSVPMFELGSLHHDFYLLNIRLPIHTEKEQQWPGGTNEDLGRLADMWVVVSDGDLCLCLCVEERECRLVCF